MNSFFFLNDANEKGVSIYSLILSIFFCLMALARFKFRFQFTIGILLDIVLERCFIACLCFPVEVIY